MIDWDKLNTKLDEELKNMTDESWEKWQEDRLKNKAKRRAKMIDLRGLEKRVDELLKKETKESLSKWLSDERATDKNA